MFYVGLLLKQYYYTAGTVITGAASLMYTNNRNRIQVVNGQYILPIIEWHAITYICEGSVVIKVQHNQYSCNI